MIMLLHSPAYLLDMVVPTIESRNKNNIPQRQMSKLRDNYSWQVQSLSELSDMEQSTGSMAKSFCGSGKAQCSCYIYLVLVIYVQIINMIIGGVFRH